MPQGALGRPCPKTFRGVSIGRPIGRLAAGEGPGLTFVSAPAPPVVLTACLCASHPHHPAGSPGTTKKWWGPKTSKGFPGGSDGKESACNAGDLNSIPGLGRSPGGGHGNPLQYSCLENPHGQRSLAGYSPWVTKSQTRLKWLSMHTHNSL